MTKVSIIVPVYKAEKYIRRCLDSIQTQTFTDFEVLLIDDGSPDRSGEICDEYAAKDSRFRVFHKKNGGVSSARNLGIDNSNGEFLCFCDADDFIPKHTLFALIAPFSNDIDSTVGGYQIFGANNVTLFELKTQSTHRININEAIRDFYPNGSMDWQRYVVNRMFRMDVIHKHHIRFREDIYYKEDGLFLVEYLCKSQKDIVYVEEIVYVYCKNEESATGKIGRVFNPRLYTNIKAHAQIVKTIKKSTNNRELVRLASKGMLNSYIWLLSTSNSKAEKLAIRRMILPTTLATIPTLYLRHSLYKVYVSIRTYFALIYRKYFKRR